MSDTAIKVICPATGEAVSTGIDFGGDAESIRIVSPAGLSHVATVRG